MTGQILSQSAKQWQSALNGVYNGTHDPGGCNKYGASGKGHVVARVEAMPDGAEEEDGKSLGHRGTLIYYMT